MSFEVMMLLISASAILTALSVIYAVRSLERRDFLMSLFWLSMCVMGLRVVFS